MDFDGTPLQLVSEGYSNSTTETKGRVTTKGRSDGKTSPRGGKRQPRVSVQHKAARLAVVSGNGSSRPRLVEWQAERIPRNEPESVSKQASAPVRLLVVVANEYDRKACCHALQCQPAFAVDVLEAETGQDGLQMAIHHPPDCVLLANALPDMSSMEFLVRLKEASGSIPPLVLNLSEKQGFTPLGRTIEYDAYDCLVKDKEGHYLDLLPSTIKRMLEGHQVLKSKHKAEAMYRTLIEHIQAITYIVSPHHGNQIVYVSPQIEQLGISPERWMANPALRFQHVHEEDRGAVEEAFSHSCQTGEVFCQDYRLCCSEGGIRWFHDTASVVKDHHGQPMFLQGVMVDITHSKAMEDELEDHRYYMERRVAQRTGEMGRRLAMMESCNASLCDQMEKLLNNNARLSQAVQQGQALLRKLSGGAAVVVVDENAWVVDMTDEAARLTGWDAQSAIGHRVDDVINLGGADFPSLQHMLGTCVLSGDKGLSFNRALLKYLDGHMTFVSGRLIPLQAVEKNTDQHESTQPRYYALLMSECEQPGWLVSWCQKHGAPATTTKAQRCTQFVQAYT